MWKYDTFYLLCNLLCFSEQYYLVPGTRRAVCYTPRQLLVWSARYTRSTINMNTRSHVIGEHWPLEKDAACNVPAGNSRVWFLIRFTVQSVVVRIHIYVLQHQQRYNLVVSIIHLYVPAAKFKLLPGTTRYTTAACWSWLLICTSQGQTKTGGWSGHIAIFRFYYDTRTAAVEPCSLLTVFRNSKIYRFHQR